MRNDHEEDFNSVGVQNNEFGRGEDCNVDYLDETGNPLTDNECSGFSSLLHATRAVKQRL